MNAVSETKQNHELKTAKGESTSRKQKSFSRLPPDIIISILLFLPPHQIIHSCKFVNKNFYNHSNKYFVWKSLIDSQYFPTPFLEYVIANACTLPCSLTYMNPNQKDGPLITNNIKNLSDPPFDEEHMAYCKIIQKCYCLFKKESIIYIHFLLELYSSELLSKSISNSISFLEYIVIKGEWNVISDYNNSKLMHESNQDIVSIFKKLSLANSTSIPSSTTYMMKKWDIKCKVIVQNSKTNSIHNKDNNEYQYIFASSTLGQKEIPVLLLLRGDALKLMKKRFLKSGKKPGWKFGCRTETLLRTDENQTVIKESSNQKKYSFHEDVFVVEGVASFIDLSVNYSNVKQMTPIQIDVSYIATAEMPYTISKTYKYKIKNIQEKATDWNTKTRTIKMSIPDVSDWIEYDLTKRLARRKCPQQLTPYLPTYRYPSIGSSTNTIRDMLQRPYKQCQIDGSIIRARGMIMSNTYGIQYLIVFPPSNLRGTFWNLITDSNHGRLCSRISKMLQLLFDWYQTKPKPFQYVPKMIIEKNGIIAPKQVEMYHEQHDMYDNQVMKMVKMLRWSDIVEFDGIYHSKRKIIAYRIHLVRSIPYQPIGITIFSILSFALSYTIFRWIIRNRYFLPRNYTPNLFIGNFLRRTSDYGVHLIGKNPASSVLNFFARTSDTVARMLEFGSQWLKAMTKLSLGAFGVILSTSLFGVSARKCVSEFVTYWKKLMLKSQMPPPPPTSIPIPTPKASSPSISLGFQKV